MHLFIETPEMRARRLAQAEARRGLETPAGGVEPSLGNRRQSGRSELFEPAAAYRDGRTGVVAAEAPADDAAARRDADGELGRRGDAAFRTDCADAARRAGDVPRRLGGAAYADDVTGVSREQERLRADDAYSIEQESYQEELAFHKRRARRSRLLTVVRVLLCIVAIPVVLALVFIGAYALTCILDGATPEELAELMAQLFQDVGTFIVDLLGSL